MDVDQTESVHWVDHLGVTISFGLTPGDDPDVSEEWDVLFPLGGPDWTPAQLREALLDVPRASDGGCCGGGLFTYDARDRRFSWGASSNIYEVAMFVSEGVLVSGAYEIFRMALLSMVESIKTKNASTSTAHIPSDDDLAERARLAIQTYRNTGTPKELIVLSFERPTADSRAFTLTDPSGNEYTVDIELNDGFAIWTRLRKVTSGKQ